MTTLGHVQRGGTPGAFDRLLATRLAAAAIEHLARGEHGCLMGLVQGEVARDAADRGGRQAEDDRPRAAQAAEGARAVTSRLSERQMALLVSVAVIVGGLAALHPARGDLRPLGPVGDALLRGRAPDDPPGRLHQPVVAGLAARSGGVLVEAGAVVLADEHRHARRGHRAAGRLAGRDGARPRAPSGRRACRSA